ncbi:hypothetical protein CMI48_01750 [Candidatus Pacearchaeota archaeon]|nr:hypothetical protein [Candidatus Pacearchaeota archaeon]
MRRPSAVKELKTERGFNIMKKYVYRIASVVASAALLGSTAALAAAASYPAPFVQNGAADVAVVWGANAAPTDLVAVADITSHLQAELASQTATGGGTGPSSVSGGDFVQLSKSSDNINLRDNVNTVFGATVDDEDLGTLLADGTYRNDENTEFDFEQKISLGTNLILSFFADSDHNSKEPSVGFNLSSNVHVLNYSVDFLTDAESDVSGGDLVDIETTDLTILGKTYYVLDFDNSTLKLTLLDSAAKLNLVEGASETVSFNGKSYDVSINFVGSATQTRINVDGEITNTLNVGETYRLSDGTYVGVRDILYDSKDSGVSKVDVSLGSGKVEIENAVDIQLNDETISGVSGFVARGSVTGGKETIDKIQIEWNTDEEEFVSPGSDLTFPGFGAVKLSMGEFVRPTQEVIEITNDGTDSMELKVPIKDGTVTIPLLGANSTGEYVRIGGDAADQILRTKSDDRANLIFNISASGSSNKDKYFVASYNTSRDAESYLLRASVVVKDGKNKTTVQKNVGGTWVDTCTDKSNGDSCSIGNVELTINDVYKLSDDKYVNFTAGTNVDFNTLFTKEGLAIHLPYEVNGSGLLGGVGTINFTQGSAVAGHSSDTFDLTFVEEDKDGNVGAGNRFNVTLNDQSDGDVEVSAIVPGSDTHKEIDDDNNVVALVQSDLASQMRRIGDSSSQRQAEVTYYGEETYADVFLTAVGANVVGGGGSGGGSVLGSVSVSDAEVASVAGKNLIVVGGSCVNSVAADLVGGALCGADWEAATGVGAGQYLIQTFSRSGGNVATLVAGYNAGDTTNAAKYATTQTVDTSVGKKYVGTTATTASMVA